MKILQKVVGRWFENERGNWVYVGASRHDDDSFLLDITGPDSSQTSTITRLEATQLRDSLNALL